MAMGTLAMIGAEAPNNLVHVVIDNEVYESTGKQRSISNVVALEQVAKSSGYREALRVDKKEEIKPAFERLMNSEGPGFLLIKVEASFDPKTGRVTHTPEEIKERFMNTLLPH
jgi:thiamine pyrophosphate-dependent acetolactate synthase large subunit-like protein